MYYEIEELLEDKVVEIYIDYKWTDDSFTHEFGTQYYPPYPEIRKVTYPEKDYTEEERELIDNWIDNHYELLQDKIEKEKDSSDDFEPSDDWFDRNPGYRR
jgi:hypothetical protein